MIEMSARESAWRTLGLRTHRPPASPGTFAGSFTSTAGPDSPRPGRAPARPQRWSRGKHRPHPGRPVPDRRRPRKLRVDLEAIGQCGGQFADVNRLKAWWVYRMLFGPDPLGERLVLMWHNHFATSVEKVNDLGWMRRQNETFRRHARAPFGELLRAAVREPALLVWLDAQDNRKGKPNENLARELMELFTLGIGHYTEADVKEAARALTGWTVVGDSFREDPAQHDDGEKTLLGRRAVDGYGSGGDAAGAPGHRRSPGMADLRHVPRAKGTSTQPRSVALASGLRQRDLDIGWAVGTVLRSVPSTRDAASAVVSSARSSSSSARCGRSSCSIRRPARCSWRNGRPAWVRICSIRPMSAAGRGAGPGYSAGR